MTKKAIPIVPVDDSSLDLLLEALDGSIQDDGSFSGEFSMHRLLEFWSGYDPGKLRPISEDTSVYEGVLIHPNDVLRALITEIKRFRNSAEGEEI